ncbi:hypothetical protein D3C72_1706600 [compost metagenome]
MHQNIRFRGQPESRQFLGDRRFRRIAGDKQRVFIFITLRVNADATQRVEVHLHHVTAVVLNSGIQRRK